MQLAKLSLQTHTNSQRQSHATDPFVPWRNQDHCEGGLAEIIVSLYSRISISHSNPRKCGRDIFQKRELDNNDRNEGSAFGAKTECKVWQWSQEGVYNMWHLRALNIIKISFNLHHKSVLYAARKRLPKKWVHWTRKQRYMNSSWRWIFISCLTLLCAATEYKPKARVFHIYFG